MAVDFLNTFAHLVIALLIIRWLQMKLPQNGDFNKSLAFLFH